MIIEKGQLAPELVEAVLQQIAPALFGQMRAAAPGADRQPAAARGAAGARRAAQRGRAAASRRRRCPHPRPPGAATGGGTRRPARTP